MGAAEFCLDDNWRRAMSTALRIEDQTPSMSFDRKKYFDSVRASLFSGGLSQRQVDGQEAILGQWERGAGIVHPDLRHLAYPLSTTYHETSKEMWPIEEYGKGSGQPYGKQDPETKQTYYGRGYVQLTWRDNYRRATDELGLTGEYDLEWNAAKALDPQIAADVMFRGMEEGWFRTSGTPNTLSKYFNPNVDDAYTAREIINGDKHIVPSWSNGVSIGNLCKGYHQKFLTALQVSLVQLPAPPAPVPVPPIEEIVVTVSIFQPPGVRIEVNIDKS
jgi:hypothetical protein